MRNYELEAQLLKLEEEKHEELHDTQKSQERVKKLEAQLKFMQR